jgi:hypothetical protein
VYAEALHLLAKTYHEQCEELAQGENEYATERARLLVEATQFLQPVITGPDNRWPNPWSDVQRETALNLAALHIRNGQPSSPYAAQLLTALLRGANAEIGADANSQNDWRPEAKLKLVMALARNEKFHEAQAIVDELTAPPAEYTLDTIVTLADQMQTTKSEEHNRAMGEIVLALIKRLDGRETELNSAALTLLNTGRAAAFAASGDRAAALVHYEALTTQVPKNGDLQERYAALLAQGDSPDELRKALHQWQHVENHSRRGGDRWRRARKARIELLCRLGNSDEADQLLRVTRVFYPDWDAPVADKQ